MTYKWLGAALIIATCSAFGISIAAGHKREERLLKQLLHILEFTEQELRYRLTPLPDLCRQAGNEGNGILYLLFHTLSQELDRQCTPDVPSCMLQTLNQHKNFPAVLYPHMIRLGQTLGRFDLTGQLQSLASIQDDVQENLMQLKQNREERLHSYRTLGICAGIALVVLLV